MERAKVNLEFSCLAERMLVPLEGIGKEKGKGKDSLETR